MSRRGIAGALAGTVLGCLPAPASAQGTRVAQLAFLGAVPPGPLPIPSPTLPWAAFFREMEARGWAEGRNLKVAGVRFPALDAIPSLAADLVASRPDVIVTDHGAVILALRRLASTIPIVFHLIGYPDELGLVASLARPGANVTGAAESMPTLHTKWIELWRELIPGLRRLGLLWPPGIPAAVLLHAKYQRAAADAGLHFTSLPVDGPGALPGALAAALDARVQALHVHSFFNNDPVWSWAVEHRLPTMGDPRRGALMGYGADVIEQFENSGRYVAQILHGKSPAELPVVLPRRFRLGVNLRTARAIGVELPRRFRIRVDRFIDE